MANPIHNKLLGRWSAAFVRYRGVPGDEVVVGKINSAPVFMSEAEALGGAERAMDALQAKGLFPDMCTAF
jgi:hypothetical protein